MKLETREEAYSRICRELREGLRKKQLEAGKGYSSSKGEARSNRSRVPTQALRTRTDS
jgi:hypothetical protein